MAAMRRLSMMAGIAGAVTACAAAPAPQGAAPKVIRVATFNAYLNRAETGGLVASLSAADDLQAEAVAEIIRRVQPDIILVSEFDRDKDGRALSLFRSAYLENAESDTTPALYPYAYTPPVNTGLASGRDLDHDGAARMAPGSREYAGDAFGFGEFPGQYGFALLSKYPIDAASVRCFQKFLWKDMPGALLPDDPATPAPGDWYDAGSLAVFRLSSKNHCDIPVDVGGARVHILASHPTPPTFDGEEDRNGRRNHDELRLWADYIAPGRATYLYDDAGAKGGLAAGARFVILGDFNADPIDGDAAPGAVAQLLDHPMIAAGPAPQSRGGPAEASLQGGANLTQKGSPANDTADFIDDPEKGPGNLRLDYVLASRAGFSPRAVGVFWPAPDEEGFELVGEGWPVVSSDHRLVWVDLELVAE